MAERHVDGDFARTVEETQQSVVTGTGHVEPGGERPRLALGPSSGCGGDDVQDEGNLFGDSIAVPTTSGQRRRRASRSSV
jgi:hypothetical protein